MSTLTFVKYQGAGNDFVLIDDRAPLFKSTLVPTLCHRKFGIGADGVILLQCDPAADFRMRIFNSDGSEAESCGNGLRCLMQFLLHLGLPKKPYRIAIADRIIHADYLGDKISVHLGQASHVKRLYIAPHEVYFLDTGVPHAVLFVPDVRQIDLLSEAPPIRHHATFQPRGTNVNFAALQPDGSLHVRTFERGLEGETLACGTGAAAVGYIASQRHRLPNPISIHFPGGVLEISIDGSDIRMVGQALKVFEGVFFV
ncbi:MAG TPA: diaminopimelate epimerase [Chlamydiales bacterium]|nr:diaminopimelate epimerase [Chlamydiales bacterium]